VTIEEAAAFAHERWCNWMHWMDAHWNDMHALGELFLERRYRQAETLYEQLSDAEKDSDRQEAAAWMNVLEVGQLRAEVARLRAELAIIRDILPYIHDGGECETCTEMRDTARYALEVQS